MKLLAFDTSTDLMSIAVGVDRADTPQVWEHSGVGGAQASTHLIPAIMALLAQAQIRLEDLDAIAFGAGPGSFTGLRTACSVAQGLGLGADRPLLPVDSLLAVAEDARQARAHFEVVAALDARMGELYAARYVFDHEGWRTDADAVLTRPQALVVPPGWQVAGNVGVVYGALLPMDATGQAISVIPAMPSAAAMLRLAPTLLRAGLGVVADQALPRYIRDKVAQTTEERAALRRPA